MPKMTSNFSVTSRTVKGPIRQTAQFLCDNGGAESEREFFFCISLHICVGNKNGLFNLTYGWDDGSEGGG